MAKLEPSNLLPALTRLLQGGIEIFRHINIGMDWGRNVNSQASRPILD